MPDQHYPDGEYNPGVPDLSGLDFAVDMMRNAHKPTRDEMPDSTARQEVARLAEELRQAHIVIGGLRQNLDEAKSRAEHIHKTNQDVIGRNQRLKQRLDAFQYHLEPVGYRCEFIDSPGLWLFNLGGEMPESPVEGIRYERLYVKVGTQ